MFRSALIAICLAATVTACDSVSVAGPTEASSLSAARHGVRGVLRRVAEGSWKLEFSDQRTAMLIGGPTALYAELENRDVYVIGLVGEEGIIVESMEEDTLVSPEFMRRVGKANQ